MAGFRGSTRKLAVLVVTAGLMLGAGIAQADFTFGTPTNLGSRVNSPSVEGTPVMPADSLSLYFDSSRSGGSGDYDVWVTTRETVEGEWSAPVSLASPVNSSAWDGVPSISPDDLTLFLCSYRTGGRGGSDIWMTSRESKEDPWTTPVNLGPLVNSPDDDWTQSISADGLELYFSSWRPGGMGNADLWLTTRATIEDDWSAPVNLGSGVNSSSDDVNPSISPDGLCLFFFSVRPGGYGNRDIWVTTRASRDEDWRMPVNPGPPLNTGSMDQGASFSPDGSTLLFCSNRSGTYGSLDLMQVSLWPVVDFNGDGKVNGKEVLMMAQHWGQGEPACDIGPTPFGDGVVDVRDLTVLAPYIGAEIDDPTLRAHWLLDETEGMTVHDSAGGHDGTLMGSPVWQPAGGVVDGALEFDGGTFAAADFVLNPQEGPFSVFAWVKGGAPGQAIISQQAGYDWLVLDLATGALMTELRSGGRQSKTLSSAAAIADDTWHRVAFTWDGANRRLYVDNILVAEDADVTLADCNGGVNIGCGAIMTPNTFFTGLIDDVRIYNRAVRP